MTLCLQNGTLLNLMVYVQGDPTREWLGRRSTKDFLSRLEERVKEGEGSPKEEGEEEEEGEEGDREEGEMPKKKRLKIGLSEGVDCVVVCYCGRGHSMWVWLLWVGPATLGYLLTVVEGGAQCAWL